MPTASDADGKEEKKALLSEASGKEGITGQ